MKKIVQTMIVVTKPWKENSIIRYIMFFKKNYDKMKNSFRRNHGFNVLHNRFILYFMLFLSTINLMGCGLVGDLLLPTFFVLIGIITSFFSKNMTVILTIALVLSNIIKYATKGVYNEGFQDDNDDSDSDKDSKKKSKKYSDNDSSKKEQTKVEKTKISKDNIEGMQDKYKELMTLQDTILGQIGTLEESLISAEKVVNNIVNSVEPE